MAADRVGMAVAMTTNRTPHAPAVRYLPVVAATFIHWVGYSAIAAAGLSVAVVLPLGLLR
ncbi:hypothetical protein FG87_04405 [Nocardia vulneris]|uniref:Uncharacterized protein n=1 Tax=Nocardia vulneris TaxID=1141657 RepID=A0ABR4ZL89_9NOCA|nr:hypothetical protein FG87_04405 [Nocardia vulneris]